MPKSALAMQNPAMAGQRYLFGAFTLDASTGTLLRDGAPVPAGQRAIALLEALVAAAGEVVTKDRLIEAAWPRAVVEESNLSVQIAAVRKLLGPLPGGGDAIGTVARVGYRFLFPVTVLPAGEAFPVPPDGRPSIAVRPLANLSGDAGLEYLADGISEDIIMALSRFRWFRVASRGSSFAFKAPPTPVAELAERLNVRYVLEGSLRGAESRLAFTLQLTDALSDSVAWSDRYEIGSAQLPALKDGVAQQVAGAIEPELLKLESAHAAHRRARSASVQDIVHRGTFLFHQVGPATHREARELFRQACGLDPAFGQAQFWLARVCAGLVAYGWTSHPDADLAEGLAAAAKAIQADERDPYAHYALAIVSVFAANAAQAMRAAQRALELAPRFALGHLVLGMARLHAGDAAGAVASLEEGLRLNPCDPQNFVWQHTLSTALLLNGDAAGALEAALHARALRPDWSPALEAHARSLVALGRADAARECMAQLRAVPSAASDVLGPLRASRPDWADALQAWLARAAPSGANAAA
jgi:TolB-like protein/DNA-binding winged helix-turn-helix (wHTH) protein